MAVGTFLEHRGQRVLLADYSGQRDIPVLLRAMDEVQALIEAEPPGSVRYLMDVRDARWDTLVVSRLRELGERSRPWFRATAIVGLAGLQVAVHEMLTRVLRLEMPVFPTRDAALDWLASR